MRALVANFLADHPECRLRALGDGRNAGALDLEPFGHPVDFLDSRHERGWIERYFAANRARFLDAVALPRWVLFDLYLMPAAIGLVTCPARYLAPSERPPGLLDDEEAVAAAYYAAPSAVAGTVIGVSSFALREHIGAAAFAKAMTLRMLKARVERGITQWSNRSIRAVHARMGILRVEGSATGHALERDSFVYSIDLTDEDRWARAMAGTLVDEDAPPPGAEWIPVADGHRLADLRRMADAGEPVAILPPGLSHDGAALLVRTGT